MRILSLLWGFSIGGIGKCLLAYQRLAEQTDFDVHTACIQLDCVSCNLESLEDIGATIIRVKNRRDFSWVRKCQKLIDQYQPDMLFVHGFNGPVVAKILQYEHKDRLPFVCSYHGLYHPPKISRLLPAPIFNSSAEYIYKHYAKGIVSVAHYCKKYLVSRGVPETKITVIHNGITKAQQLEKKLTRAEVGLSNEDFVIGATSRLDPVKGLKYLIDAFTRIIKVVPNAKLILVGSGSVEKQLRARCRWLNIKQAVLFPGYQSDVDAWLNLFDLFVLPSLHEYHSLSILEAMRAGLPIVATDVGGNPESIQHGKEGLLVLRKDSEALKTAICRLAVNCELRKELGQLAKARFERDFTEKRTIERTGSWLLSFRQGNSHNEYAVSKPEKITL